MAKSIPIETIIEPHRYNRRRPSIADTHPRLNIEWCYEKNCGFGPCDFTSGSEVAAWWRCSVNPEHVWQRSIEKRTSRGHGCPYCKSRRAVSVSPEKSLAKLNPEAARRWHPEKNDRLKPSDVTADSNKVAWWLCPTCGHEWHASVKTVSRKDNGCPRCRKNMKKTRLDLRKYPYALACFDRIRNVGLDPTRLDPYMKFHWRCPKGEDHLWCKPFNKKVSEEKFCPFCNNRMVSATNCLAKRDPKLAGDWHPKRNGQLQPNMVTATAKTLVWWLCRQCNQSWKTPVYSRFAYRTGCPHCWKFNRPELLKEVAERIETVEHQSLQIKKMYKKGVPQTQIARRFGVTPLIIRSFLAREKLLKCIMPTKSKIRPISVSNPRKNRRVSEDSLSKRFPEIAKEWHPTKNRNLMPEWVLPSIKVEKAAKNRKLTPADVGFFSSEKVWWQCKGDKTHEWEAIISARTLSEEKCPHCARKRNPLP